ncbi:hypothetical protein [Arthrobacter rhombi]|uniref:hypothetical protein n=1 Tax=Arthrobacter rhombi TaxID=71253 RepID=UPI003FD355B9
MNPEEIRMAVMYANGIDPRIQMNVPTAELWGRVVGHKSAAEVKAAILVYYERYPVNGRENPPVSPAMVRKIITDENDREQAQESAQQALPAARPVATFRTRDPEGWDALVQRGRDEHREDLRRRGIALTDWQLAHKPRPSI